MSEFRKVIETKFGIELPAILKLEYKTKDGKFDRGKYSKALENFFNTIDEIGVFPFEDFLIIGVENLHELDSDHQNMLRKLATRIKELEIKAFPEAIEKMIQGLADLQKKHPDLVKKEQPK